MEELRFDGRVAVVTGAGRGLGRAYALLLAARGARVVVNDNGSAILGDSATASAGPAEAVVEEIRATGGEAIASTASVADPEAAAHIVTQACEAFGRVDIVIHNAGNVRRAPLHEMSLADFNAVLDVHLMGAFYLARAAIPLMRAHRHGRIVLTSSIGGFYGNRDIVNYAVSKAGVMGLSRAIAVENAEFGIASNLILPGAVTRLSEGIDTSQFPPMDPALVAPMVAWLAHERCTASGEIYAAIAGRMARVDICETVGAWREAWSIEDVAASFGRITDPAGARRFGLGGFQEHLGFSFAMARNGGRPPQ